MLRPTATIDAMNPYRDRLRPRGSGWVSTWRVSEEAAAVLASPGDDADTFQIPVDSTVNWSEKAPLLSAMTLWLVGVPVGLV